MMFGRKSSNTGGQDDALLSSIQAASQSWESFNWTGKLEQAEANLNQSKEAREQSVAARKDLAETTKQFKRSVKTVEAAKQNLAAETTPDNVAMTVNSIDSMAKDCRVIVKSYQGEIDNLTRRCKNAENAYSSLCQALTELPDPFAVLSTVAEQMQRQQKEIERLKKSNEDATKETEKLKKEVSQFKKSSKNESGLTKAEREELVQLREDIVQYEIETKNLRNQDVTVRKLEARIAELQENAELEFQEKLEKAREELAETEGRRAEEALEREAAMGRQVENMQLQLKAERAGREAAQSHLLDADEGAGEREAAWEAQRRILVDDAERLRQTLHQVTRERDDLSMKLGTTSSRRSGMIGKTPPPSGGLTMEDFMLERKAYEAEVAELSHTANALREELKQKEESVLEERRGLQARVESLEQENASLKSSISSSEAQLASAPSQALLNSMKRELRILKRLEYNADDVDAPEDPELTGAGVTENEDEKDLESVLVEKLRRSESDLVKERNARLDQAKECDRLKKETEAAVKAKEESEKLVQSLEKDLERAIASPPSTSSTTRAPRSMPMATRNEEEQASALNSLLDPDAPPAPAAVQSTATAETGSSSEKADDDHSVATIVMAQRDRLRARCEALEAERDSFKRELQVQVQSAESLKTDNTKLYEKVRYLQNFANNTKGGYRGNDRDLDLEALEQRYEASVDPFRQFSRAERQRKMQEMPPMERIVFIVAKTVLGTKAMRTALCVYVTCLHLLVFITTAHWSHSGTCDHSDREHLAHLPPHVVEQAQNLKEG